jgi:serine/threonine protein phosphatase PrpC
MDPMPLADTMPRVSSSGSRCGTRHVINEDSVAEFADAGIFVVADGVGGHTDGALASRSIVEIVRRVAYINADLDAKVADIEAALHSVNEALWREASSRPGNVVIGSTVAALIMDEHHAVCVWCGDSRIYLRRRDHLYQLTTDHTLDCGEHGASGGILTRAVGSAEVLALDRAVISVARDDTYLVCSDGITKTLMDKDLDALLADPGDGAAERLIASAVAEGATDDVSAIIVHCPGVHE